MSSDPSRSQDQPVPTPTGKAIQPGANSSPATITGATKTDVEEVQSHVELVEGHIKKETNPVRRQNAEVCLEFVKQHGYPAPGYHFLIHQGVIEVLNEDDWNRREKELAQQIPSCSKDAYALSPPITLSPRAYE